MLNTKVKKKKGKENCNKETEISRGSNKGEKCVCVYKIPGDKSQNICFYFLFQIVIFLTSKWIFKIGLYIITLAKTF